jgi:chromosome segregation ATPase
MRGDGPSRSVSEESQAQLQALQDQLGELQDALLLASVQDSLGEMQTTLTLLPTEIEKLRSRGYVFRSFLERKVEVLTAQWEETSQQVSREVSRHSRALQREADEAERAVNQAMGGGTVNISRAQAAVEALEHKVEGARSAVRAMYDTLRQNVNQTKSQVEQIKWALDQLDQASFQLHPAEDTVAACKAQFMETKKEGPEGVLYLTDERLIFEQKEKRATKKVLFIATEKETVQELIFAVPVGQIEKIQASQKGFLGRKEMMELLFTPEADWSGVSIRLRGADNEEWAGLIGRVKSGEIAKERTRPKEEAVMETARSAPTQCPTCGAALDVEIVRGMRQITCEYCGTVIRL